MVPDHRDIVGNSMNNFSVFPFVGTKWFLGIDTVAFTTESNSTTVFRSNNLPRIAALQPIVWTFYLKTVSYFLLKLSILVSYTIPHSGISLCRQSFKETRCKTSF